MVDEVLISIDTSISDSKTLLLVRGLYLKIYFQTVGTF